MEENESRSIIGRADINALLDQFVHEKQISPKIAESYRETAKNQSSNLDIENLCYGSTYVPSKIAIEMQQENHLVKVIIDSNDDNREEIYHIKPQFPLYLYPIQKSNDYGAIPILTPTFVHKEKDTSIIWSLVNILTLVEDLWFIIKKIQLRASCWHGWILTYIAKKCLTHHKCRASKRDPFIFQKLNDLDFILEKIVSILFISFYCFNN